MSQMAFIGLLQETIMLILMLCAPVLVVAMAVGIFISLFQAVTQIQEATLTFVPKILVSLAVLVVACPWMLSVYIDRTERILHRMVTITE
jgi:flagellar biosynthesis protein FliQ